MKVFVVMRNDYPDRVFADETEADAYVDGKENEQRRQASRPTSNGLQWVSWRHYEFDVQFPELDKDLLPTAAVSMLP